MSLTQLRKRARETPGISEKKKVEGKWIPKDKDDLIADFKVAFAPGAASASVPPDPMTKSERDAKRRQTEDYKAKERERHAAR